MAEPTFTLRGPGLGGSFALDNIADRNGYDGGNVSPALEWSGAPRGTKSFAILMHDPDAPVPSGFWHWAVFDIPAGVARLEAGAGDPGKGLLPEPAFMGRNDAGQNAYLGPCPPRGDFIHGYHITAYALDVERLGLDADVPLAQAAFQIATQRELARATIVAYVKPPPA